MRKVYRKLAVLLLTISVLATPMFSRAADTDVDRQEEDVEVMELDSDVIVESHVEYVDALSSIQPRVATQGTATKYTSISYNGIYVGTILQEATFVYGAPNGVVTISSKRGTVYAYDPDSPYRIGTITTTYANGSPATVTSSYGLFLASDWSRVANQSIIMRCYNSGKFD